MRALCETHLAHKVEVVTDPLLQGWRSAMKVIGPPRHHNNLHLQNKLGQKMVVTIGTCIWALQFPSPQRPYALLQLVSELHKWVGNADVHSGYALSNAGRLLSVHVLSSEVLILFSDY